MESSQRSLAPARLGYSGDSGSASMAQLYQPYAVIADRSGNLFIADYGNDVIRKVSFTRGDAKTNPTDNPTAISFEVPRQRITEREMKANDGEGPAQRFRYRRSMARTVLADSPN